MERRVLYIDTDEDAAASFRQAVQGMELELDTASGAEEAERLLEEKEYRCMVDALKLSRDEQRSVNEKAGEKTARIIFTDKEFGEIETGRILNAEAFVSRSVEGSHQRLAEEIESLLEDRSKLDYPVPEDENSRLEAVRRYDIEKLRKGESFDRLTEIAAEIFGTKWCFVGLITSGTEHFLSFYGSETDELERRCTICTFTISEDEDVMVVQDRETDPRFKNVDELDDLGIKWYAGAPMVTDDGYRIGAFCVMDEEKKAFSEEEREVLQLFAEEAMDKLELERQNSAGIIQRLRGVLW